MRDEEAARSGNASGNQPGPGAPVGDAAARTLAVAGIDDHAGSGAGLAAAA